jgi:hypothetical protein
MAQGGRVMKAGFILFVSVLLFGFLGCGQEPLVDDSVNAPSTSGTALDEATAAAVPEGAGPTAQFDARAVIYADICDACLAGCDSAYWSCKASGIREGACYASWYRCIWMCDRLSCHG